MNLKLFVFIFCCLSSLGLQAQGFSEPDLTYFDLSSAGTHPDYHFKLYFNIIRDDNGNSGTGGYDENRISNIMDVIDDAFNPLDIFFEYECQPIIINSTERANNGNIANIIDKWCLWENQPMHSDGIDIYIISGFKQGGFAGAVNSIPGSFVILNGGLGDEETVESSTVVHELGHLFGLLHMYHGSTQNESIWGANVCTTATNAGLCNNDFLCPYSESFIDCVAGAFAFDTQECAEDSNNGAMAGDYIPDTPPSHLYSESSVSQTCFFDPTNPIFNDPQQKPTAPIILDPEGNNYNPDIENFMAVSNRVCRTHFTPNQVTVMKNHIATHPILQPFKTVPSTDPCPCNLPTNIYVESGWTNWSTVVADNNLNPDQLENIDIIVKGNLVMDLDYSFLNVSFIMAANSRVILSQGADVDIEDSSFDACDQEEWQGIEVYDESELLLNNVFINYAHTAVEAIDGSSLTIFDIIVDNCSFVGVFLNGDVQLNHFIGGLIRNTPTGIRGEDGGNYYPISGVRMVGVETGVRFKNASGFLNLLQILESEVAVELVNSPLTTIFNSELGAKDIAIDASDSYGLNIEFNFIGFGDFVPLTAINLVNVTGSTIIQNDHVQAIDYGILGTGVSVTIKNNDFEVSGLNVIGGGIGLNNANSCEILRNKLDVRQSSYGIELSNSENNDINNNDVFVFSTLSTQTKAISLSGCTNINVEQNIVDGQANATGIIVANSSSNTFDCNEIDNTEDGLYIGANSEFQQIRGNDFLDADVDLTIRSEIGIQSHRGNLFHSGTTEAIGLTDVELGNSLFLVNSSFASHLPSNPTPGNGQWFVNQNGVTNFYQCQGIPGPGWLVPPDGITKIRSYVDRIKSLVRTDPNMFFVKVFHLLRLENNIDGIEIPDDIKNDPAIAGLCGMKELLQVDQILQSITESRKGNQSVIGNFNEIQKLQSALAAVKGLKEESKILSDLNIQYKQAVPFLQGERNSNTASLLSAQKILSAISCRTDIAGIWKAVYQEYIQFLQPTVKGVPMDQALIRRYSALCADEYGDAVHQARALAATFDNTDYSQFDQCQQAAKRTLSDATTISNLLITPNPTAGYIDIKLPQQMSGQLTIQNVNGQVIYQEQVIEQERIAIDLSVGKGIFILKFSAISGTNYIDKIIVTQ